MRALVVVIVLAGVAHAEPRLANPATYIPSQCYAQTKREGKPARNPCFACHRASIAPNFVDDPDVQTTLSIPRAAADNPWTNTLRPPAPVEFASPANAGRAAPPEAVRRRIDDAALLAWVRTDNRTETFGCAFAPDRDGWDRDPQGNPTGWRAYAFAPMPGMFWPTNGSIGDAYIRLPDAYRRDTAGQPSLAIYALNLAIAEATIRRANVPIAATDERALGVDLDGNGRLGVATKVAFRWPQHELTYVGAAAALDRSVSGWPAAGLYPVGTEIVHSVRYLDVAGGRVRPAARMKELRYMKKARWLTYSDLDLAAKRELREKEQNPDELHAVFGDGERGVGTGGGWLMRGFIEDAGGALRPQTLDETAACIGCHGGVGATVDGTFSFGRKVGWGAVATIREPRRADGRGEYVTWLDATGAGDDFGTNAEVAAKVFGPDGKVKPAMARAIAKNISIVVMPSATRALALDRVYLAIVRAQTFARGRDALLGTPLVNARLEQGSSTGVPSSL